MCKSVKPSIQKLVNALAKDSLLYLSEETIHTASYTLHTPRVLDAIRELETEFSPSFIDKRVLKEASAKRGIRVKKGGTIYGQTVRLACVELAKHIESLS